MIGELAGKYSLETELLTFQKDFSEKLGKMIVTEMDHWIRKIRNMIMHNPKLRDIIYTNIQLYKHSKIFHRMLEEWKVKYRDTLNELLIVKGTIGTAGVKEDLSSMVNQIKENDKEISFVTFLKKDRNDQLDNVNDGSLTELWKSMKPHRKYLRGLHLNLSNSAVTSQGIRTLIEAINGCPQLTSIGLDLGQLQIENSAICELLESIEKKEQLASLALGFHKSPSLDNPTILRTIEAIEKRQKSLRMLRVNFSNTSIEAASIEKLVESLPGLELEHLEVFVGGNKVLDDALAAKIANVFKEGQPNLRGFEFDFGFSGCTGATVGLFDGKIADVTRAALYANGLEISAEQFNKLADFTNENKGLNQLRIEVKENTGLQISDINALKSVIRKQELKVDFTVIS